MGEPREYINLALSRLQEVEVMRGAGAWQAAWALVAWEGTSRGSGTSKRTKGSDLPWAQEIQQLME
jgi:hypothetical protein